MKENIKPIALYLPQYHEIEENNQWWGKGFTEWTNVKKARPLFKAHYQPHIPQNGNYYDLSEPQVMSEQAALAKAFGIYGFCFYHYWFNGKLLLEKPLHQLLSSGQPDFPFCLSWANENWTRTWDGEEKQVLMKQNYSLDDDRQHIRYLMPFFKDPRYIKMEGKPVFLMYRSELHPDIQEATKIWREEAKKAGFPDLYLIRMENFKRDLDPAIHGFDAGMEFAPDSKLRGKKVTKSKPVLHVINKLLHQSGIKRSNYYAHGVFSFPDMVRNMIARPAPAYPYFRCICPSWDNSARRKKGAAVYMDATPSLFKEWAGKMMSYTRKHLPENKQLLFINAWNEWGEGCHLEPDEKWGTAYLEALQAALLEAASPEQEGALETQNAQEAAKTSTPPQASTPPTTQTP